MAAGGRGLGRVSKEWVGVAEVGPMRLNRWLAMRSGVDRAVVAAARSGRGRPMRDHRRYQTQLQPGEVRGDPDRLCVEGTRHTRYERRLVPSRLWLDSSPKASHRLKTVAAGVPLEAADVVPPEAEAGQGLRHRRQRGRVVSAPRSPSRAASGRTATPYRRVAAAVPPPPTGSSSVRTGLHPSPRTGVVRGLSGSRPPSLRRTAAGPARCRGLAARTRAARARAPGPAWPPVRRTPSGPR